MPSKNRKAFTEIDRNPFNREKNLTILKTQIKQQKLELAYSLSTNPELLLTFAFRRRP
jgi:hypothetical protein